jgi:DNA primase
MPFVDFAELKKSAPIIRVVEFLEITVTQHNKQLRCACPRCGGGDRSLVITPEKQAWYCFGAKKGGDVISLVAHLDDSDMKTAADKIAGMFLANSTSNSTGKVRSTVPEEKPERKLEPLDYLQAFHENVLNLGVDTDTAKLFGAGFASKGIMRGRMAIPIHTRSGELIAYCGRATKGESPTLIFPNGFQPQQHIFNAHRITEGELYLTRDPLDVLLAYQNGIENVVSFLTEEISAEQLTILTSLMDGMGCDTVALF